MTARALCARIGCEYQPVAPGSKLGVSRDLLAGPGPFHGLRHPPSETTSGWYLWTGELDDRVDFFVPLHVEHLVEPCPLILPYLALPPGYRFLIDAAGIEDVWFDAALLHV